MDAAVWAAWWEQHGRAFPARRRVRFGQAFTLAACVDEAEGVDFAQATRALAMQELMLRSSGPADGGCEADWFIERQLRALGGLRARAETGRGAGR